MKPLTKRKVKQRAERVMEKVPHDVRQRYVNMFTEEFLKTSPTVKDAFEKVGTGLVLVVFKWLCSSMMVKQVLTAYHVPTYLVFGQIYIYPVDKVIGAITVLNGDSQKTCD